MAKDKKNKVKGKPIKKEKENNALVGSVVLLVIMVFSVVSFSMTGGGGGASGNDEEGDAAFGQIFQNPETGELYWGAIINGERFIFASIEGYDAALVESALAKRIKSHDSIDLYIDDNFESSNAQFLIEKSLRAFEINYTVIQQRECDDNTLVLTTNTSFEGECMKFIAENSNAEEKANKLVYHMVK